MKGHHAYLIANNVSFSLVCLPCFYALLLTVAPLEHLHAHSQRRPHQGSLSHCAVYTDRAPKWYPPRQFKSQERARLQAPVRLEVMAHFTLSLCA
jgi:hypothetical protein